MLRSEVFLNIGAVFPGALKLISMDDIYKIFLHLSLKDIY